MRILSISSQVAWGPVGNTAAVPALQARGHEVIAVPTIMLSNHPGHGTPAGFRTQPEDISRILDALDGFGILAGCDAVFTGYFASPEQVEAAAIVLERMTSARPSLYVLVDPVMGDEGGLYVPQPVAEAIRDRLVPLATCITPNRFELAWLSGHSVSDEDSAIAAARAIGTPEVLATSIPHYTDQIATLLVTVETYHIATSLKLAAVANGTGDFLSGLYLARRLAERAPEAFAGANKILARAIAMSAGTPVLDIAGALHGR
ncbi:pyridoxal kinase [Aestuariivirga sp.]|uniref:pyridoxal kinase n=1 Tax=Aestuariivirga sp. TaxID=2650926 RepID=UPI00359334DA